MNPLTTPFEYVEIEAPKKPFRQHSMNYADLRQFFDGTAITRNRCQQAKDWLLAVQNNENLVLLEGGELTEDEVNSKKYLELVIDSMEDVFANGRIDAARRKRLEKGM